MTDGVDATDGEGANDGVGATDVAGVGAGEPAHAVASKPTISAAMNRIIGREAVTR